jgi:hypothetical protein
VPFYEGTAPRYEWRKNTVVASTSPTYSYAPSNGDVVYCIIYSNYRCRLQDSAISNSIHMTVDVPSTPVVSIAADPGLTVSAGQTITLSASVTGTSGTPSYQWQVNGGIVPGAIASSYSSNSYNNGDLVTCQVLSGGICSGVPGTKSVTIRVIGTSVGQLSTGTQISVIPNPSRGTFVVKGSVGTISGEASIEIRDVAGRTVYTGSTAIHNGTIEEQLQLENISSGTYLLTVRTGDELHTFHLVMEK